MLAVDVSPIAKAGFTLAQQAQLITVPAEWEPHATDAFASLYEPQPTMVEECPDEAWHKVVQQALESASYKELHEVAMLEHEVSGIATDKLLPELLEAYQKQKQLREKEQAGELDEQQVQREQARLNMHVRAAVARAEKEAKDAKDLLVLAPQAGDERVQFLKMALRMSPTAREAAVKLARLYGRMREDAKAAEAQQIQRVLLPVGVALGDDVLSMLPAEYVLMHDPDLELLWLSRFVDKSLMVYERQTTTKRKLARGDAVVLVDESGSMSGENVQLAKAFALMVKQSVERDAGRTCHLASFSTQVCPAEDILQWAQQYLGGGTSFDRALEYALKALEGRQNADVVLVTDGEDTVDPALAEQILQHKREHGWRLFVTYINHAPRSLQYLADSEVLLSSSAVEVITEGR